MAKLGITCDDLVLSPIIIAEKYLKKGKYLYEVDGPTTLLSKFSLGASGLEKRLSCKGWSETWLRNVFGAV